MKLSAILSPAVLLASHVAAQSPPTACNNVTVVGDGTFCISGPVCGSAPQQDQASSGKCPQVGDTAVAGCLPTNPSYDPATGKCIAPVPADCKPSPDAASGFACVWDLTKLPPAPTKTCSDVKVVDDGTFCIQGPVCGGTSQQPTGDKCPQVGDSAVAGCTTKNPSYNPLTNKCTAPVPADCKPTPSGQLGCIWDLSKLPTPAPSSSPTPAPTSTSTNTTSPAATTVTTVTPKPTVAPTPSSKPPTVAPESAVAPANCENVSVVGDGTFCVKGPVCSGTPANQGGDKCPQVGDTAVADCFPYHPSYNKQTGKCTAPVPAVCQPQPTGVWGCVWDLSKLPGGAPAPAPAPKPTPAVSVPSTADCTEVSVVGDGTFCVKGPVCSGTPTNKGGDKCPQVGDTAVKDCFPYHPSYNKQTGKCTAPVPADCKPLPSGAWGCVWDLSKLPKRT
ncbi:hypothetical protein PINS_up012912 [Pythium insidiosum]|nr:hypothetical protein PINS_up012912 [Pythium insidiosum]